MASLVSAAVFVRRGARASFVYLCAAALGLLELLGVLRTDSSALGIEHALVAAAWVALFSARAANRFRAEGHARTSPWLDLELGVLLLVATHGVVQIGGGLAGPLYPLVYVLVAF